MLRHGLIAVPFVLCWQERELSIEESVRALIEKTGELESFHAFYDMEMEIESGDDDWATIELVYRAPDFGCVRVSMSKGGMEYLMDDRSLYWRSNVGEQTDGWHRADWPAIPAAVTVFAESFGRGKRSQPGASFGMKWGPAPIKGLALKFSVNKRLRPTPLGWLVELAQSDSGASIDGDSFVLENEGCRRRISRVTGFLDEVETLHENHRVTLRLREVRVNEPLDPDLVTIPPAATAAAVDPEWVAQLELAYGLGRVRRELFIQAEQSIASGKHPWNDLTRASWREVLDALHRQKLENHATTWKQDIEQVLEKASDSVRSRRESGENHDKLEEWIASNRQDLEEQLLEGENKYREGVPPISSEEASPREELFDVEREVIASLWNELLRQPALAAFDEKLEAALGR